MDDGYKKGAIRSFFKQKCNHLKGEEQRREAERLTETVIAAVEHTEGREKDRQVDAAHIGTALKKINLALQELDKTKGPEGQHLKNELQKVKDQVAAPVQEKETERVYYNFQTIHDKPDAYSVTTGRKKKTGDQAEYMFRLWAFWISEFGEKPSKYKDHPFFKLAGKLLDIEQENAYKQWLRNTE